MEKFRVKQERTYTTWLTIEAETRKQAEEKYWDMVETGEAYSEELNQMEVGNETYEIYRVLPNGRHASF